MVQDRVAALSHFQQQMTHKMNKANNRWMQMEPEQNGRPKDTEMHF